MADETPWTYGSNIPAWVFPFHIIPFLVLGATNGFLLGAMELGAGGVSPGFSFSRLIGFSLAGIVSLLLVDFFAMIVFPNYPWAIIRGDDGKTLLGKLTVSAILGGITNGVVFWGLHNLEMFQYAGWFGNAIAGAIALVFYTVLAAVL